MAGTVIAVLRRAGRCRLLSALSTRERSTRRRSFGHDLAAIGLKPLVTRTSAEPAMPIVLDLCSVSSHVHRSGRSDQGVR